MSENDIVSSDYSDVYTKLVQDRSDLVGAIAYALYKSDKRDFIAKDSLPPDHADVRKYHLKFGKNNLSGLRKQAEELLSEHTSRATSLVEAQLRTEKKITDSIDDLQTFGEKQIKGLRELIKSRTSFWGSVLSGVCSAAIFALLLTVAIMISGQNPLNPWIQQKERPTPTQ